MAIVWNEWNFFLFALLVKNDQGNIDFNCPSYSIRQVFSGFHIYKDITWVQSAVQNFYVSNLIWIANLVPLKLCGYKTRAVSSGTSLITKSSQKLSKMTKVNFILSFIMSLLITQWEMFYKWKIRRENSSQWFLAARGIMAFSHSSLNKSTVQISVTKNVPNLAAQFEFWPIERSKVQIN